MKKMLTIAAICAAAFGMLGYSMPSWGAESALTNTTTSAKAPHGKTTKSKTHKAKHHKAAKKSHRKEKSTQGVTAGGSSRTRVNVGR